MLGLFVVFFYSPVIKTHAEESQQIDVRLSVRPVINLSVDTEVLELNTYVNTFVHDSVNVSVTTNSAYGYTLGLEDVDEDSSMHHVDDSISNTLTSYYSGAKTSEQMANNTWGFSLDKTNYYYVPTRGNTTRLKVTYEQPSDTDVTEVDFGAKVGIIASGYYYDTVMFSAYVNGDDDKYMVNPGAIPSLQTFSSGDCADMRGGDTLSLVDERDGKTYRMLKGTTSQCWMVDNLSLETTGPVDEYFPDHKLHYASSESDFMARASSGEANLAYIDPVKGGFYTRSAAVSDEGASICPGDWYIPEINQPYLGNNFNSLFEEQFDSSVEAMREFFPATDGYIDPVNGFTNATSRYWANDGHEVDSYAFVLGNSGTSYEIMPSNYGLPVRCVISVPMVV